MIKKATTDQSLEEDSSDNTSSTFDWAFLFFFVARSDLSIFLRIASFNLLLRFNFSLSLTGVFREDDDGKK